MRRSHAFRGALSAASALCAQQQQQHQGPRSSQSSFWRSEPRVEHGERSDAWGASRLQTQQDLTLEGLEERGYEVGPLSLLEAFYQGKCSSGRLLQEKGSRASSAWSAVLCDAAAAAAGLGDRACPEKDTLEATHIIQAMEGHLPDPLHRALLAYLAGAVEGAEAECLRGCAMQAEVSASGVLDSKHASLMCRAVAVHTHGPDDFEALLQHCGLPVGRVGVPGGGDVHYSQTGVQRLHLQRYARYGGWRGTPGDLRAVKSRGSDLLSSAMVSGLCASSCFHLIEEVVPEEGLEAFPLTAAAVIRACAVRIQDPDDVYGRLGLRCFRSCDAATEGRKALDTALMRMYCSAKSLEACRNLKVHMQQQRRLCPEILSEFRGALLADGDSAAAHIIACEMEQLLAKL